MQHLIEKVGRYLLYPLLARRLPEIQIAAAESERERKYGCHIFCFTTNIVVVCVCVVCKTITTLNEIIAGQRQRQAGCLVCLINVFGLLVFAYTEVRRQHMSWKIQEEASRK